VVSPAKKRESHKLHASNNFAREEARWLDQPEINGSDGNEKKRGRPKGGVIDPPKARGNDKGFCQIMGKKNLADEINAPRVKKKKRELALIRPMAIWGG